MRLRRPAGGAGRTGCSSAFLTQVMSAGVFHADPHPGNILIDPQGTLWLIDFGAVGLIDPVTMDALHLMGAGLATGQPALLARALRSIAGSAGDAMDTQALEAELSRILSEQLHAGGFDPRSLQEIINIMGAHEIPVPPDLHPAGPGPGHPGGHAADHRPAGRPGHRCRRLHGWHHRVVADDRQGDSATRTVAQPARRCAPCRA